MADGTQLGIPTMHTAADLRTIATVPVPATRRYYVREIEGVVAWEPSISEADDSSNIIQPTDRSSLGGRWVKIAVP